MTAIVHCIISVALASVIGPAGYKYTWQQNSFRSVVRRIVHRTPEVRYFDSTAHEIFADFYHLWDYCSDGANDMCPY